MLLATRGATDTRHKLAAGVRAAPQVWGNVLSGAGLMTRIRDLG